MIAVGNREGGYGPEQVEILEALGPIVVEALDRKRAEAALRQSEERLSLALETSRTGAWDVDLADHTVQRSLVHDRIFGHESLVPDWTYEMFLEHVLPEDREAVDASFQTAVNGGSDAGIECRIRLADGEIRWIWVSGRHLLSGDGAPHLAGIVQDITERKTAEEALRENEERYRRLAEENERLYRQQLDIAESLQSALLNIPSEIGRVTLGHLYRSATQAARVGGDFYDVFPVKGGHIAVLIGDVSGHGIEAARTATLVKDVVHAFAHQSLRTNEVLRRTNALLVEKELSGFVTLFLGILDAETGVLRYASAGHPEALLRRVNGEIQVLGSGSAPLGVYAEASWKPAEVELDAGDLLLLYTDGVLEARCEGEFFGEKRLERIMKRRRIKAQTLPQVVLDKVLAFSGGTLTDDIAVLALSLTEVDGRSRPARPFAQESLLG
jgi:PAS domain S-box-containing protein